MSRVTSATVASGLPILAFKKLQKDLFWFVFITLLLGSPPCSTDCSDTDIDFLGKGTRKDIQLANLAPLAERWLLSGHKLRSLRPPWELSFPPQLRSCAQSVIALCPCNLMVSSLPPPWYRIQRGARGASISRNLWLKAPGAKNHFSCRAERHSFVLYRHPTSKASAGDVVSLLKQKRNPSHFALWNTKYSHSFFSIPDTQWRNILRSKQ